MNLDPALALLVLVQYDRERAAAVAYDAAALAADNLGFDRSAARFAADAREEEAHARRWLDLLRRRGAPFAAAPRDTPPPFSAPTLPGLYADVLALERHVTAHIAELASAACAAQDHALYALTLPFLAEQEQAEYALDGILRQLADLDAQGLRLWDAEQGEG